MADLTLRERAIAAACALHNSGGSQTCEVGVRTTDAVLGEVAQWLEDLARASDALSRAATDPAARQRAAEEADLYRALAVQCGSPTGGGIKPVREVS